MRFRHEQARKTPAKRIMSFLLMLCLLVPMIPMNARADETGSDSDTVTITLHDLYIDRKEALPDGTNLGTSQENPNACLDAYTKARSITVTKGTTLAQAFDQFKDNENLTLGTSSLAATKVYKLGTEDEKAMTSKISASECIWYTRDGENGGVDGNGTRTQVTSATVIDKNIDLFTYSYRLRLVTGKQNYKDLIVREGQKEGFIYGSTEGRDKTYKISDFLNSNSVNNTWKDINTSTSADTSALTGGLTRNYILRQSEKSQNTTTLTYYAAVDGEWKAVKTDDTFDLDRVDVWGKTGPALNYYVTDDELEAVYGKEYGFEKSMFKGGAITKQKNGYFPYGTDSNDDLHIRQMPKYETVNNTTQFRVPLIEDTGDTMGLAVYYTPHNTTDYQSSCFLEGSSNGNGSVKKDNTAVLRDNSFYTVSADTTEKFDNSLPSEGKYYLYGSDVALTFPSENTAGIAVKWYVEKGGDNVTIAADGTVTILKIDQKVILTTDQSKQDADAVKVHCYVLIDGQPVEIGLVTTKKSQSGWDDAKSQTRYYVTAEQVAKVFEKYGFKASEFKPNSNTNQKYIFANAISETINEWDNPARIWADVAAQSFDDSSVKIPLVNKDNVNKDDRYKNVDLYYLPNNKTKSGYVIDDLTGKNDKGKDFSITKDTAFLRANSYFSITTKNKTNSSTQYVWAGEKKEITLPDSEAATWTAWYCSMDGKLTPVEKALLNFEEKVNNDNTITFTFSKISAPILITTDTYQEDLFPLKAYVALNGTWTEVNTKLKGIQKSHITGNKYYITSEELEYIYGKYGFKSSDWKLDENGGKNTLIFGCASPNEEAIWADNAPTKQEDGWYLPIVPTDKSGAEVYYLPKNTNKDAFDSNGKTTAASDNAIYEINISDGAGAFDGYTDTQYALTGTDKTITLPYDANVNWYVESDGKTTKLDGLKVSDDGNHATYTFKNVTSAINLTTNGVSDKEVPVSGYISVDGKWTKISSTKIPTTQTDNNKYYLTSAQLEKLFSSCDFKAEKYKSITDASELSKHFPSSVNGNTNISTTAGGKTGDSWQVNTIAVSDENRAAGIAVYYLPDSSDVGETITTVPEKSIFHSISFKDSTGTFESKDLPKTIYRLASENVTVTAPYNKNVTWYVEEEDSGNPILTNQTQNDGEVTIPIPSFHTSVVVTTTSPKKSSIPTGRVAVNLYVAIDDTWESVTDQWTEQAGQLTGGSFTLPATQTTTDGKFYITEDELKNIFGVYGFTGIPSGDTTNHFPHSTITKKSGSGTSFDYVWGDTPVKQSNGKNYITLIASGDSSLGISIYYAPDLPTPTGTDKKWGKTDYAFLSANSIYYTVSASDRKKVLTEEQKKTITFPETQKLEHGKGTKYTLPELPNGFLWTAVNKNTGQLLKKSTLEWSNDKLTCTISSILEPIQFIVSDGSKSIFYDAQITTEKLTNHGSYADPSQQKVIQDGTIKGNSTYTESLKSTANDYTVLDPDSDRAEVNLTESNHPRVYYYTFQYWQVEGTNTILKPGESLSKLQDYDDFEQISLKAVWKAVDQNERPTTVNFYISLKCEIMDNVSNGVGPRPKDGFTETVYATRIHGTDSMNKSITLTNSMFSVLSSDDGENAYNTDAQLRQMETVGIPTDKETQGTASLTVEHFPSDEEVFENLRADTNKWNKDKKIMLDGQEISRDQLTTANYAIRWYVLKYEDWDAWHIDGVLVAKEAHAVVTKTFAGNETAINKVIQGGYSISVTHDEKKESNDSSSDADTVEQDIMDYNLVLKKKGNTAGTNEHGYDSYDEATNTYTWILTGRQGRQYKVKENYYKIQNDSGGNVSYDGTYRYMIENCTDSNVTNNQWNAYNGEDITLTAEAYPTDVPSSSYQTIAFENRYVSAGHFTVQKIDSTTNRGLKNVSFTLRRTSDGKGFDLYRKGKTSEYYLRLYSNDSGDSADDTVSGEYTLMNDNTVVTDDQGYFYIYLPDGTYELTESVPLGYKGASKITITVNSGKITANADDSKWITVDNTSHILTVKNESQLLTTVTALKQWNEHTKESDRKSVKVELWRNGAKMDGAEYTQELNADNNWQYEWKNLPLFIDGEVAQYKLREISIGNTMYDTSADTDGYADYNVSYEDAKYYEGESRPELADKPGQVDKSKFISETASWHDDSANHEQHYANHALLVVNNSLAKGYISFSKRDGLYYALEGAEFTLYSDKDCTQSVAKATSQSDGTVLFESQSAGTYYMKESKAPTGYVQDTIVYTVTVSKDGEVKITKPSASKADGETDSVMSIINKSARTLTLKKVSSTTSEALAGAEFTISRNDEKPKTFTTDETGRTDFGGLRLENGEYTITETKAPDGYKLLDVHVVINVDNGTVKAETHDTDVWSLTHNGDAYTLTVKNAPISNGVLPDTGGYTSRTALAAMLGAALMCGASALAMWLRKRRGQE